MSHKKIYNLITLLQNTSSSNKKKEILSNAFETDPDVLLLRQKFIDFLIYVYNEVDFVYNLKKIPFVDNSQDNMGQSEIEDLFQLAEQLNELSGGEDAKKLVVDFLERSDEEMRTLFDYLMDRSINAGVEAATLAKVFPELDHLISPYMRCEKENQLDNRIKYPAIAQIKADGLFMNCFIGGKKFITRYGNRAEIGGPLKKIFDDWLQIEPGLENKVIMGEFLIKVNGVFLPRQVGNGKINKLIKKEKTLVTHEIKVINAKTEKKKQKLLLELEEMEEEWKFIENHLFFKYWDIVTEEEFSKKKSDIPYAYRLISLNGFCKALYNVPNFNDHIGAIESKIVNNREEVYEWFDEVLLLGEEGLVVKNADILWHHDTNRKGIIKLKNELDCDLKCVGYEPGKDEYTGGIGSLICESSDSRLVVSPSSGLSMEQRGLERVDKDDSSKGWRPKEDFDLNQYMGKIIAVKYNSIMPANDKGIYSLFIPKIEEIREAFDKTEADSIDKILEKG